MQRTGIVVPHTHWDRAWYLPFQAYRLRLVEVIAELLDLLEANELPVFVLDGQTVVVEDHLVVRPHDRDRIRSLVESGRIRLGPWYTMPDCFLARPESLIRNLQRGLEMAAGLGGGSRVGYVPDSFGHFAQLPQILAGFGIDSFLFMRGMPEDLRDAHGAVFRWRSPDGSEVLATFLREGYFPLGALGQEGFHGRYDGLDADPTLALERLNRTLARLLPLHRQPVVVLPAGGDHLPARGDLAAVIDHLNAAQSEVRLVVGGFEDYVAALRGSTVRGDLPVYSGDLLGQADHPLLRNVLSSRIDLKILNHRAQSILTRVVEPLAAWAAANGLPIVEPALIQTAWDALLKNHAHDDICGCSVDDVHLDDVQRFHEVLALAHEIVTRQVEHLVRHRVPPLPDPRSVRVFAFNPHPWAVETSAGIRILLADPGGEFSEPSAARQIEAVDAAGRPCAVRVLSTSCNAIRSRYLETTWGRAYEVDASFRLPPLGFELLTFRETPAPLAIAVNDRPGAVPEPLTDALRFELDADLGDGYSHGPCPELPVRTARLIRARADDRLPDVFHLDYELRGPSCIRRDELADAAVGECLGPPATMGISVRARRHRCPAGPVDAPPSADAAAASVPAVAWELRIVYTNVFSDGRLRVVIDPLKVAGPSTLGAVHEVIADGQARWQAIPARPSAADHWDGPLATPAYPGEKPYPVHHTNDGVVWAGAAAAACAGGAGLHEFELVPSGDQGVPAAAFTLHRAVGSLSVRGGRIRSCQAGPQRPTPDAQLQRRLEHTMALGTATGPAEAMRLLKQILHPCWIEECTVLPTAATPREAVLAASILDVGAAPIDVMCVKPATGAGVMVRLLNPTPRPVTAPVRLAGLPSGAFRCSRVSLDEERTSSSTALGPDGRLDLEFGPFEIQTWRIEPC